MKKLNSEINFRNETLKNKENFSEQNAKKIKNSMIRTPIISIFEISLG